MTEQFDLSGLSAEELDEIVARAAKLRAETAPQLPLSAPEPGAMVVNPAWFTMLGDGGSVFQVRHPGHGWLAFLIPPAERAHLLTLLLQQALIDRAPNSAGALAERSKGSSGRVH